MEFFKAYDMRGTFGVDFTLDTVYRIGLALPRVVPGPRWLVGRDCRLSSSSIRDALVAGLTAAGAEVTDLGLCTTPMVYFFTGEDGYDGSVMITASHNPPSDNGLKVSCKGAYPVSYASGLSDVERIVGSLSNEFFDASVEGAGEQPDVVAAFRARYRAWQIAHADLKSLDALRLAVDCSNGMSSLFARDLFPNALILNDRPDGHFPSHSPNPLKPESREQLASCVRENHLDCGVIFDGDADRAMFVDEKGDFVQPDTLIPVLAQITAPHHSAQPSLSVLHDIRTSRGAIETLRELGFEPVMVPVGPSLAKPLMREKHAPCGGELAGHYYFAEFHYCDSGLLAATRILSAIAAAKGRGETFSEMMRPITGRYANSGEINFRVEDKDAAIARVLESSASFGDVLSRSDIDGVRLDFADGWFNVRKSNTEPYLRLIVENRTRKEMERWLAILRDAIG